MLAHRTNLRVGLIIDSIVFMEYSKNVNNCFKGAENQIILFRWDGECTRMTLKNQSGDLVGFLTQWISSKSADKPDKLKLGSV